MAADPKIQPLPAAAPTPAPVPPVNSNPAPSAPTTLPYGGVTPTVAPTPAPAAPKPIYGGANPAANLGVAPAPKNEDIESL